MALYYVTEKICAHLRFHEPSASLFIDTPPFTPPHLRVTVKYIYKYKYKYS